MNKKTPCLIKAVTKNLLLGFIVQFLLLTTLMAIDTKAQAKSIDEIFIKLTKKEIPIKEVFSSVETRTRYVFVYPDDLLHQENTISLKGERQSVYDLLADIAKDANLKFKQVNNAIYVGKASGGERPGSIPVEVERIEVKGRVTDQKGAGIPGATVLIEGTTIGTATDIDGNFTIEAPEESVLMISFIGYKTQRVIVGNQTTINVIMEEDLSSLDEVVVVGYGTQKKVNLTGAVSTVTSAEIVNQPVGQTSMALQGITPGVTVTQRSGQPGSDGGTIRIRGIGTLTGGGQGPLIMVDGVETNLNNVDPNEIESISILKDASSAAIYGARAAGGVVLVTTKRGVEGVRVNYNMYAGYQVPTALPDIVGALDHMMLVNEAYTNIGNTAPYTEAFLEEYRAGMPSDRYPDTDWQELTMSNSVFMHNHNISINAGSERTKLFGSISYLEQDGIIPN